MLFVTLVLLVTTVGGPPAGRRLPASAARRRGRAADRWRSDLLGRIDVRFRRTRCGLGHRRAARRVGPGRLDADRLRAAGDGCGAGRRVRDVADRRPDRGGPGGRDRRGVLPPLAPEAPRGAHRDSSSGSCPSSRGCSPTVRRQVWACGARSSSPRVRWRSPRPPSSVRWAPSSRSGRACRAPSVISPSGCRRASWSCWCRPWSSRARPVGRSSRPCRTSRRPSTSGAS